MSKFVCIFGVLLLVHAAISVAQYRGILRTRGETEFHLPSDILLECIFGLIIASFGATRTFGDYQDISSDSSQNEKPIEALLYRPGFHTPVVRRYTEAFFPEDSTSS